MEWDAEMAGYGKRLPPMPLCRGAAGALGAGCADAGEGGARRRVIESRRKAAEHRAELLTRDRGQDHAGNIGSSWRRCVPPREVEGVLTRSPAPAARVRGSDRRPFRRS